MLITGPAWPRNVAVLRKRWEKKFEMEIGTIEWKWDNQMRGREVYKMVSTFVMPTFVQ
jgi:hypothetical protein